MKKTLRMLLLLAGFGWLFVQYARAGAVAEAGLSDRARMLLDYQSFARADRDGAVRFTISSARELQGTPLAELAVRLAMQYDPATLSSVEVGEVEARRLLTNPAELTPELRDITRRFLARGLAYAGRRDEAVNIHRQRGLAMDWLLAGPFDNPATSRFHSREFPETGEILRRDVMEDPPTSDDFREWRRRPPWQPLPANRSFPFVRPWRVRSATSDGMMLLLTGLDMQDADNNAAFHILSDTSWRLYIDGALVAEVDKNNHEVPVEHMVPFPLTPGKRAVVLQLFPPRAGIDTADARVALRLESSGRFAWTSDIDRPSGGLPKNARREARRMRYLSDLQKAATEGAALGAAFSLAAAEQGMLNVASWWVENAAKTDNDNIALKVLAGLLAEVNPLLPLERRRDSALEWHRAALAQRQDLVPSLLFMAKVNIEANQPREASRYLNDAYAVNPGSMDVLMARGEWAKTFASGSTIRDAWDEARRVFPKSPTVHLAVASMPEDGFLDMKRRLDACRAAVETGPYNAEASMMLAGALADSGDRQEAESVLLNALELFAGDVDVLTRISAIYSRLDMTGRALEVLREAVRIAPANAGLWRMLGDLNMESGNDEAAKANWRVSLAAEPGQFELRDMLDYLEGKPGELYRQTAYDAIALPAAADPDRYAGDLVRLLD
ncbi:MAG: hypothetical protein LIP23_02235, partial [Planctomycetes bacterium]|nr:hypothetical protein [Planctomycetota bacterium]